MFCKINKVKLKKAINIINEFAKFYKEDPLVKITLNDGLVNIKSKVDEHYIDINIKANVVEPGYVFVKLNNMFSDVSSYKTKELEMSSNNEKMFIKTSGSTMIFGSEYDISEEGVVDTNIPLSEIASFKADKLSSIMQYVESSVNYKEDVKKLISMEFKISNKKLDIFSISKPRSSLYSLGIDKEVEDTSACIDAGIGKIIQKTVKSCPKNSIVGIAIGNKSNADKDDILNSLISGGIDNFSISDEATSRPYLAFISDEFTLYIKPNKDHLPNVRNIIGVINRGVEFTLSRDFIDGLVKNFPNINRYDSYVHFKSLDNNELTINCATGENVSEIKTSVISHKNFEDFKCLAGDLKTYTDFNGAVSFMYDKSAEFLMIKNVDDDREEYLSVVAEYKGE